jgi:hypothetical protein
LNNEYRQLVRGLANQVGSFLLLSVCFVLLFFVVCLFVAQVTDAERSNNEYRQLVRGLANQVGSVELRHNCFRQSYYLPLVTNTNSLVFRFFPYQGLGAGLIPGAAAAARSRATDDVIAAPVLSADMLREAVPGKVHQ